MLRIARLLRQLPGGSRGKGIGNGRAHRRHVHDPADRRAAEEGENGRDREDAENGAARRKVPVFYAQPLRKHSVIAERAEQAAQRDIVADQTGYDAAEGRGAQQHDAGPAHRSPGRMKGRLGRKAVKAAEPSDIVRPVGAAFGQCCYRKQDQQAVGCGCTDDCDSHDPERAPQIEPGLCRRMRDRLEAHISPGRQRENGKGTAELTGTGSKGRLKYPAAVCLQHGCDKADDHATQQDHRHHDLPALGPFPVKTDQRCKDQRSDCQQDFAEPYVESCDLIVEAELKGPAQYRPRDQRQGGRIGPDNSHIGQNQKPGAQKAVIVAESCLRIAVGAAAVRKAVHQIAVVHRQDQHDRAADAQAEGTADRPRDGEEGSPGHDESAPADAAAEGQRPCPERSQVFSLRFQRKISTFPMARSALFVSLDALGGFVIQGADRGQLFFDLGVGETAGIARTELLRDLRGGLGQLYQTQICADAFRGVGSFEQRGRIHRLAGCQQLGYHAVFGQLADMLVQQLVHTQNAKCLVIITVDHLIEFLQCHLSSILSMFSSF